jgi:hypothetical protein
MRAWVEKKFQDDDTEKKIYIDFDFSSSKISPIICEFFVAKNIWRDYKEHCVELRFVNYGHYFFKYTPLKVFDYNSVLGEIL